MAGSLTIGGMSAGLLSGSKQIGPVTMSGSQTVGEILDEPLKTGDNTIAVPEGAVAVMIALPLTNTVAITIRTNLNNTDHGLPIANTGFMVLAFAGGTTSLILNAASATAALELSFI